MAHRIRRSAVTGKFVKKSKVKSSPRTTTTETTAKHRKGRKR